MNKKPKPHLEAAHEAWRQLVKPGDTVIDATCGNGHDTLLLAQLALTPDSGQVIAMDIQPQAIANTQARLQAHLTPDLFARIRFIQGSHAQFPADIAPGSVKLIVYNLGYLPGGDKSITTQAETTLESLSEAVRRSCNGGCISLNCYPGHADGAHEERLLLIRWREAQFPDWRFSYQRWRNCDRAPSLLLFFKLT